MISATLVMPYKQNENALDTSNRALTDAAKTVIFFRHRWAVSSAGEHCLHTAGVVGSNPTPPTIESIT